MTLYGRATIEDADLIVLTCSCGFKIRLQCKVQNDFSWPSLTFHLYISMGGQAKNKLDTVDATGQRK